VRSSVGKDALVSCELGNQSVFRGWKLSIERGVGGHVQIGKIIIIVCVGLAIKECGNLLLVRGGWRVGWGEFTDGVLVGLVHIQ
jgi:hypothetical protein